MGRRGVSALWSAQPDHARANPNDDWLVVWNAAVPDVAGGAHGGQALFADLGSDRVDGGLAGAARYIGASSGGIYITAPGLVTGQKFVAGVVFEATSNWSNPSILIAGKTNWDQSHGWYLNGLNTGAIELSGGDGSNFPTVSKAGIGSAGSKGTLTAEFFGTSVVLFFNGERIGSATLGTAPGATVSGLGIGCYANGGNSSARVGNKYFGAFVGRNVDAQALSVDPWRAFEPQRIWAPVSSGGAASPVAANATYYQMIAQQRIGY